MSLSRRESGTRYHVRSGAVAYNLRPIIEREWVPPPSGGAYNLRPVVERDWVSPLYDPEKRPFVPKDVTEGGAPKGTWESEYLANVRRMAVLAGRSDWFAKYGGKGGSGGLIWGWSEEPRWSEYIEASW